MKLEKSEELYINQLFGIKEEHFRVLVPNESKKLNVWISQTDKLEQQQIDSEMNYIRSNITTNSNPSVKDEVQDFDRLDETNDETKNSSMQEQERPN